MSGLLFSEIVFGPVSSRRLGVSLGINLLPTHRKICNFNCIYCECGWNKEDVDEFLKLPERNDISNALETKLKELKRNNKNIDSITFAGNGEPSIHPEFAGIVEDIVNLRNIYYPEAKTSLLSNAGLLKDVRVLSAILKLDNNILKLDCGTNRMFHLINRSADNLHINDIVENLKKFNGKLIIQTLFLRGIYNGEIIDNTIEEEIINWLKYLSEIKPKYVMIYPIDRATPVNNLEKITRAELDGIAKRVNLLGIETKVYD